MRSEPPSNSALKTTLRLPGYFLVFSLGLVSFAAGSTATAPDSDPDWTQSYAQAQKILGKEPIALLANVEIGYAPGTTFGVVVRWAVSENNAMIRKGDSIDSPVRTFHLNAAAVQAMREKLRSPSLAKMIPDLDHRMEYGPDADYSILFVRIGKEAVVLSSWDSDDLTLSRLSNSMHIAKQDVVERLGPKYSPVSKCWVTFETVVDPVLYPTNLNTEGK
jgi:hypothetical protein